MNYSEEDIVKGINKGSQKEFRFFYESHYKLFCQFAHRFINDMESSKDIVQEAFIYVWDSKGMYKETDHIKSYLYKSIRNRCLNHLRDQKIASRNKDEIEYLSKDSVFRNIVIEEESYNHICQKIEELPEMQRNVIELHIEGHSNEEIANRLNISTNTVRTHKQRAKSILKSNLGQTLAVLIQYLSC